MNRWLPGNEPTISTSSSIKSQARSFRQVNDSNSLRKCEELRTQYPRTSRKDSLVGIAGTDCDSSISPSRRFQKPAIVCTHLVALATSPRNGSRISPQRCVWLVHHSLVWCVRSCLVTPTTRRSSCCSSRQHTLPARTPCSCPPRLPCPPSLPCRGRALPCLPCSRLPCLPCSRLPCLPCSRLPCLPRPPRLPRQPSPHPGSRSLTSSSG